MKKMLTLLILSAICISLAAEGSKRVPVEPKAGGSISQFPAPCKKPSRQEACSSIIYLDEEAYTLVFGNTETESTITYYKYS